MSTSIANLYKEPGWEIENTFWGIYFVRNPYLGIQDDVFVVNDQGSLILVPYIPPIFSYIRQEH